MAEFPALPLFTDAYLADTRHLTTEEHGAYLLLLMCAWRTRGCCLKDDDRALARIVGVSGGRWRRLRPVLADFFTVRDGIWRQKKLNAVYDGVEARVARNRENGARGGRARAARTRTAGDGPGDGRADGLGDGVGGTAGKAPGKSAGKKPATRLQNQNPDPEAAAGSTDADWLAAVAAAAGFESLVFDCAPVMAWQSAGADLGFDVLPTIARLRLREEARSGRAPHNLAYYTPAVLEARDERLGAVKAGTLHAAQHPAPPAKRTFDRRSADDWRLFLGDAASRFRGDYLARNWRIGPDHPHFLPADLGPDPALRPNPDIPAEIFATYAPLWRWRGQ